MKKRSKTSSSLDKERDFVFDSEEGESMKSFLLRKSKERVAANEEVVGTKTHAELEADWFKHFHENNPVDRPSPEWLTSNEMADKAGVTRDQMRRYLERNKSSYDSIKGGLTKEGRRVVTQFYKFKK